MYYGYDIGSVLAIVFIVLTAVFMVLTVVFIILYVKEREKARKAENRIQFNSMPAMTEVSTSENPFDDPRQNAGSRL